MQNKALFSIIKREESSECHIYESGMLSGIKETHCITTNLSMCGEEQRSAKDEFVIKCSTEMRTRIRVAELGRSVCGKCIVNFCSHVHPWVYGNSCKDPQCGGESVKPGSLV